MASTLDKLLADIRASQGLAPDPLASAIAPAATLPSDIQAPVLSDETDGAINSELSGIQSPPDAIAATMAAPAMQPAAVQPAMESPALAPPVAPGESVRTSDSSSTIVGNRAYAQGGDALAPGAMADITASANPLGKAAELGVRGYADVVAGQADNAMAMADLEAERAGKQQQAIAGDDELRKQEIAREVQFQAEAENRIGEIDREIQDVASREPDPSRFWSTRTKGQQALFLLTAALQAFSKPEEVPKVADVLSKFIDQDIKIQEDRLGRELAAAQGRGRSVRELITMGKEKDAAVYALRKGAITSLEKMLDADMRKKGAPLTAQDTILKSKAALAELASGAYKEAATGEMENRKMVFQAQQAAQSRAASRAAALQQREWELQDRAAKQNDLQRTINPNAVFYADGVVSVKDPKTGQPVNYVVLNEQALKDNVTWTASYESGKRALDDLRGYVDDQVSKGRTSAWMVKHDPEFRSRLASALRPVAQSMGYEKNISDKEADQLATAMTSGGNLDSVKGSTFGEIAVAIQNNPSKMLESIDRMSSGISQTYGSKLSANADVNYYGGQKPLIVVREPQPRSREQRISETMKARGAKEDVSAQSTPAGKAGAVLSNMPLATSEAYNSVVEIAKNTMDRPLDQQVAELRAATDALPEGSAAKRKADRLERLIIEYRKSGGSVGPLTVKSKDKQRALEKEIGKL